MTIKTDRVKGWVLECGCCGGPMICEAEDERPFYKVFEKRGDAEIEASEFEMDTENKEKMNVKEVLLIMQSIETKK